MNVLCISRYRARLLLPSVEGRRKTVLLSRRPWCLCTIAGLPNICRDDRGLRDWVLHHDVRRVADRLAGRGDLLTSGRVIGCGWS